MTDDSTPAYKLSRNDDPATSVAAAASVNTTKTYRAKCAVAVVGRHEPPELTHHEIGYLLFEAGVTMDPEVGRRAARTATSLGLLEATDRTAQNRTGRLGVLYRVNESTHRAHQHCQVKDHL